MPSDDASLPASVQRLWGLTPPPSSGQRAGLTVERIVTTAVGLADADGFEAVSMKRVATELGFTTMALYRHVASKDELVELMRDVAAGDPPDLPRDAGWRPAIAAWTWAQMALVRDHPWVAQIPVTGPPIGPHQIAWMEAGLRALVATGLPPDERFALLGILSGYVLHEVRFTRELAQHHAGRSWGDMDRAYGQQLAAVADPERFPELSEVLATGIFDGTHAADEDGPDPAFAYGLELLLDGIEQQVRRRRGRGR